jgi:type 1 glutamine amidotransferase
MRILVLCDDRWHPAQTPRTGLGALGEWGFEGDWIENAGDWSAERMAGYPLAVLTKANNVSATDERTWMTGEIEQAFLDYVRRGNGLLVIHSGTAGYRESPVLRGLIGGVFARHPPQCPVTVTPKAGHPLTTSSVPFTLKDEHYFMEFDDAQADLFLTTTSEHGEQPGGWTRVEGEGRVCVLTPGHNVEVWLHPSFQALLGNALRWCSKQTAGG